MKVTSIHYRCLTWQEVERLDRSKTMFLLPVGSIEQHGPHLPLDTDSLISVYLCQGVAERYPDMEWVIAPPFQYTYAKPSQVFPGTVSVEGETLIRMTRDALRCFTAQGFQKILVLNGHMENTDFLIEGISLALDGTPSAKVVLCNWWEIIDEGEVMNIFGPDWKGWVEEHAALVETSLMMHIAPEQVRAERMTDDRRRNPFEFRIFPWDRANYPPSGVFSATRGATREKGESLVALILEGIRNLVMREFAYDRY